MSLSVFQSVFSLSVSVCLSVGLQPVCLCLSFSRSSACLSLCLLINLLFVAPVSLVMCTLGLIDLSVLSTSLIASVCLSAVQLSVSPDLLSSILIVCLFLCLCVYLSFCLSVCLSVSKANKKSFNGSVTSYSANQQGIVLLVDRLVLLTVGKPVVTCRYLSQSARQ